MRPVTDAQELSRAFEEPWALVFKHSTRCPVSTAAHREVAEFRRRHPLAAVYVVHVVEQRDLSRPWPSEPESVTSLPRRSS